MQNEELILLVQQLQSGKSASFDAIYDIFYPLILYYSRRSNSDDAAQELTVFLLELLYKLKLERFSMDSSNSLQRYIAVCIRNKYIAFSQCVQSLDSTQVEYYDELEKISVDEYDAITEIEERALLKEAIRRLTPLQRKLILERYYYGYSVQEIATSLQISRQAVGQTLHRALHVMREYLE